jgi:hypothetical protein
MHKTYLGSPSGIQWLTRHLHISPPPSFLPHWQLRENTPATPFLPQNRVDSSKLENRREEVKRRPLLRRQDRAHRRSPTSSNGSHSTVLRPPLSPPPTPPSARPCSSTRPTCSSTRRPMVVLNPRRATLRSRSGSTGARARDAPALHLD